MGVCSFTQLPLGNRLFVLSLIPHRLVHLGRCKLKSTPMKTTQKFASATRNGGCKKILASVSLLSLLTPCLNAQTDTESLAALTPYTVNANRFEQPINEVPASVTLISKEEITRSGAVSLTQVLREKANFAYSSFSSPAQASLDARGLGGVRHTLVVVDGRVVTRPDMGQFNWSQFPLENIESVEIIKGANVALYGDRATGSVIKITTQKGTETPEGNAQISYGSYDTENARFSYTGTQKKLGYAVRGEYLSSDLYRDHSEMLNKSAGLGLDYAFSPRVSAHANVDYLKSNFEMPGRLTKAQFEATPRASFVGQSQGQGDERYLNLGGGLTAKETDYGTLSVNAGVIARDLDFQGFLIESRDLNTYTVSPNWLYSSEDWNFLLGMDFIRDDMTVKNPTGTLNDDFERDRYGFYGQISRKIDERWTLSANARHDKAKVDFKDHVNAIAFNKSDTEQAYGIGTSYLLTQAFKLWGRYEHFYRYPMIDEIVASGFGFGAATPNPSLTPETGDTVELGADYAINNWKFSANLFGTEIKDEIFFGGGRNRNFTEKTIRYGFEGSANYDVNLWGLGVDYRYITAEEDSGANAGQRISTVPNHNLQTRITVRPIEKLEVSGFARYRSSFDSDAGGLGTQRGNALLENIGAATVFDLRARYQIFESLEGFASIENLADKNYTNFVSWGAYYPEAGRTVNGGLRYRF